jgi:hypothetical protein
MFQVDTTFINDEEENTETGEAGEGNIGKFYLFSLPEIMVDGRFWKYVMLISYFTNFRVD